MEFKGIITHIFEPKSGVSASGNEWKSQEFRIEECGVQYPNSVVVSVFKDKCQIPPINTFVTVYISSQSKEFNGRYFNSLTAWKIDAPNGVAQQSPAVPQATTFGNVNQPLQQQPMPASNSDDLPF